MSLILDEVTTPSTDPSSLVLFPERKEKRRILRVALWNSCGGVVTLFAAACITFGLARRGIDASSDFSLLPVLIFALGLIQLLIAIAQWVAFLTLRKKQPDQRRQMTEDLD